MPKVEGSKRSGVAKISIREQLRGWFDKPSDKLSAGIAATVERLLGVWFPKAWDSLSVQSRLRLVNMYECPDESSPDEMQRLFDERVTIRDLERNYWATGEPVSRNEEIFLDVTVRQLNGERGVFASVATKFRLSPKTVRNIVGELRWTRSVTQRAKKKTSPK